MEPDFDQILSKKIRQAEQRPVSWNKEVVWQNVQSETTPRRSVHVFYYIAAAMVVLAIYSAVQPMSNETKSQVTEAKIESKSKAAESVKPAIPEKEEPVLRPSVRKLENTVKLPVTEAPIDSMEVAVPAPLEGQLIDTTAESLAEIQIPLELLPQEEVAVPERKIRPVVGIITESRSETIANAKPKKRLRKLQPPDETPWENRENALVFAMRK